jgi:preprotein translocase SecE subunit
MAYKKDQGRMARMAAFWSLAILIFYGCTSLHTYLPRLWGGLGEPFWEGARVPVLALDITPALVIAALILGGGLTLLYRWLEKPKTADLLIETEAELRKVTWPTVDDAVKSSVVVIVTVVFLMGFLAACDYVLGQWALWVLVGRHGA